MFHVPALPEHLKLFKVKRTLTKKKHKKIRNTLNSASPTKPKYSVINSSGQDKN